MKTRWFICVGLAAALLGLAACGSTSAKKLFTTEVPTPAVLAKKSEVKGCRALGEVRGYAEPTKSGNVPLARMTARDDLLQRAGGQGATHVVLKQYLGNRRPVAIGEAYHCGDQPARYNSGPMRRGCVS